MGRMVYLKDIDTPYPVPTGYAPPPVGSQVQFDKCKAELVFPPRLPRRARPAPINGRFQKWKGGGQAFRTHYEPGGMGGLSILKNGDPFTYELFESNYFGTASNSMSYSIFSPTSGGVITSVIGALMVKPFYWPRSDGPRELPFIAFGGKPLPSIYGYPASGDSPEKIIMFYIDKYVEYRRDEPNRPHGWVAFASDDRGDYKDVEKFDVPIYAINSDFEITTPSYAPTTTKAVFKPKFAAGVVDPYRCSSYERYPRGEDPWSKSDNDYFPFEDVFFSVQVDWWPGKDNLGLLRILNMGGSEGWYSFNLPYILGEPWFWGKYSSITYYEFLARSKRDVEEFQNLLWLGKPSPSDASDEPSFAPPYPVKTRGRISERHVIDRRQPDGPWNIPTIDDLPSTSKLAFLTSEPDMPKLIGTMELVDDPSYSGPQMTTNLIWGHLGNYEAIGGLLWETPNGAKCWEYIIKLPGLGMDLKCRGYRKEGQITILMPQGYKTNLNYSYSGQYGVIVNQGAYSYQPSKDIDVLEVINSEQHRFFGMELPPFGEYREKHVEVYQGMFTYKGEMVGVVQVRFMENRDRQELLLPDGSRYSSIGNLHVMGALSWKGPIEYASIGGLGPDGTGIRVSNPDWPYPFSWARPLFEEEKYLPTLIEHKRKWGLKEFPPVVI